MIAIESTGQFYKDGQRNNSKRLELRENGQTRNSLCLAILTAAPQLWSSFSRIALGGSEQIVTPTPPQFFRRGDDLLKTHAPYALLLYFTKNELLDTHQAEL